MSQKKNDQIRFSFRCRCHCHCHSFCRHLIILWHFRSFASRSRRSRSFLLQLYIDLTCRESFYLFIFFYLVHSFLFFFCFCITFIVTHTHTHIHPLFWTHFHSCRTLFSTFKLYVLLYNKNNNTKANSLTHFLFRSTFSSR